MRKKKQVNLWLYEDQIKELDKIIAKNPMIESRSQFFRVVIDKIIKKG
jgi:metal-responsive CopG/Arc/MetJ family transcriptional regulator